MGGDVVDAADDTGPGSAAGVVEHAHWPDPGAQCHPDHADPVVLCADSSRDMRAVAVAVVRRRGCRTVLGTGGVDVEVRVVEVDACVDHGNVDIDPLVEAVDQSGRAGI